MILRFISERPPYADAVAVNLFGRTSDLVFNIIGHIPDQPLDEGNINRVSFASVKRHAERTYGSSFISGNRHPDRSGTALRTPRCTYLRKCGCVVVSNATKSLDKFDDLASEIGR